MREKIKEYIDILENKINELKATLIKLENIRQANPTTDVIETTQRASEIFTLQGKINGLYIALSEAYNLLWKRVKE